MSLAGERPRELGNMTAGPPLPLMLAAKAGSANLGSTGQATLAESISACEYCGAHEAGSVWQFPGFGRESSMQLKHEARPFSLQNVFVFSAKQKGLPEPSPSVLAVVTLSVPVPMLGVVPVLGGLVAGRDLHH